MMPRTHKAALETSDNYDSRDRIAMMENSKKRRRRKLQTRSKVLASPEFHSLIGLLIVLVVGVFLEVVLVDTVFMGPRFDLKGLRLTNADYFMSDTGALEEGLYLLKGKREGRNDAKDSRYGSEAVIVGQETCRVYRKGLEEEDSPSIAVVGLFQKRTKSFSQLMEKNCQLPSISPSQWHYRVDGDEHDSQQRSLPSSVLPIVLAQDPYPWMTDVCRDRPLEIEMNAERSECPKLLDDHDESVEVVVDYPASNTKRSFESLASLWTEWHKDWLDNSRSIPRLVIRSEDIVLRAETVVRTVCKCVGGTPHELFRNKAPGHIDQLPEPLAGYSVQSMEYAVMNLDANVMEQLRYGQTSGTRSWI